MADIKTNASLTAESGAGRFYGTPTDDRGKKAHNYVTKHNEQRMQPLIRSQQEALKGGMSCWIYNVSHIFEWRRQYRGFGQFLIPHAPRVGDIIIRTAADGVQKRSEATEEDVRGAYKLSTPIFINHSYVASYDKGDTRRVPYVEYGEEIAESIVGNSKLYPADLVNATSNLENYGVFITYGEPFEDLSKDDQNKLYTQAMAAHQKRCFEKVLNADKMFNRSPNCITEIHRLCALEVGEVRQWVTERAPKVKGDTVSCPFCDSQVKSTAIVCSECKNVIDPVRYNKMKAKLGEPDKEVK